MAPVTVSLLLLVLCYAGTYGKQPPNYGKPAPPAPTVKRGSCPTPRTKCMTPLPKGECDCDSMCPGDLKCCTPECTPTCTKPILDRPGKCPVVNSLVACSTPAPKPLCKDDLECPGEQKCCLYGCQVMCADPTEYCLPERLQSRASPPDVRHRADVHATPPAFARDPRIPSMEGLGNPVPSGKDLIASFLRSCGYDSFMESAPTNLKYAAPRYLQETLHLESGELKVSQHRSGKGPLVSQFEAGHFLECLGKRRLQDSLCLSEVYHCRKLDCTSSHVPPQSAGPKLTPGRDRSAVKRGSCQIPRTKCMTPLPKGECDCDSMCPGDLKCCTPECTPTCTKPILVRPGKCPVVNTFVACSTPAPKPLCKDDLECPGKQKCCLYGCQIMCTDPAKPKP
ncbi:uncharacterized protein [Dendropsophus ebraccatus]|uniref:uncharacterized protein n=1 Tax=Dendropsophus ebraccatus TaxID=150705 RepID=UPI00383224CE